MLPLYRGALPLYRGAGVDTICYPSGMGLKEQKQTNKQTTPYYRSRVIDSFACGRAVRIYTRGCDDGVKAPCAISSHAKSKQYGASCPFVLTMAADTCESSPWFRATRREQPVASTRPTIPKM